MAFLDYLGGLSKPIMGNSLDSFLHPDKAYQKGMDEYRRQYEQARQQSQGYIDPYHQQGQEQFYGNLRPGIANLLNPESLMNRFTSGYETSPYAQQMLGLNKEHGLDAASSMGLMGSSAALGNIQQGAGNIVNQDRENYIKSMMDNYLKGLGLSENVYNQGANMSGNYASNLLNQGHQYGQGMANMAFGEQRAPGNLFGQFLRAGANMYGGGQMGAGQMGGGGGGGGFLS